MKRSTGDIPVLEIEFSDGSRLRVSTDDKWQTRLVASDPTGTAKAAFDMPVLDFLTICRCYCAHYERKLS